MYIGHLLREPHATPTRDATFNAAGQFNVKPKCRAGGQRKKWTEIGFQLFWESALPKYIHMRTDAPATGTDYNKDDRNHRRVILNMAIGRMGKTPVRDS